MHIDDLEIQGFDPLIEGQTFAGLSRQIAEEAVRREVTNILKSYTGYFDVFSELLQNALDAIDIKCAEGISGYEPKISIEIDIPSNRIRVSDNGTGMSISEFKYCFRPNVSFKERRKSRGHKGVGATFIAYGFVSVWLQSRKDGNSISARLKNGRLWAEDVTDSFERPTFEETPFESEELSGQSSGTSVEVIIGEHQRPILSWMQASSAKQWLDILRIKTPIGGVYLTAEKRQIDPIVIIKVTDLAGSITTESSKHIDYYYPHEIPLLRKTKSIREVENAISSIHGDPSNRLHRLPDEYRRLDAVYEVWSSSQILNDPVLARNLDEDGRILIEKHNISMYGCFLSSATTWTLFQKESLRVRTNAVLLRGGLQLASDYMPQGDLLVIPLTSTIGYQANTHIVVHLDDGNPDMGRKVFQPEIKTLGEELARRAVDIFKRYLNLMREDTGAPTMNSARELRDFIQMQERHRIESPLEYKYGAKKLQLLSTPRSEQDVVALFHGLMGLGVLKGLNIFATSESERYDCIFNYHYPDRSFVFSEVQSLGVSENVIHARESIPLVLEYKFDSDSLVADFSKEKKFVADVKLLVCWSIGSKMKSEFNIRSLLVGDEGSTRECFGATHALYQDREKRFEAICLEDLLNFLRDEKAEAARQSQLYR